MMVNNKGGVGKTVSSVNLAAALANRHESGSRCKELSKRIFNETLGMLLKSDKYQGRLEKLIPDSKVREWWNAVDGGIAEGYIGFQFK